MLVEIADSPLAPARRVLCAYEQSNAQAGHENAGFLSAAHGYLPMQPPLQQLGPRFSAWDQIAAELPALYRDLSVRRRVSELPLLDASRESLPDPQVLRACALLAMLAHAYWYSDTRPPASLPAAIATPWSQLRARLGRSQEVLSYVDLIVYNWRLKTVNEPAVLEVEQLDLLFPTIGNREERVFYLTQLEILSRTGPVVRHVADAQAAMLRDDDLALARALEGVGECLRVVLRTSLRKIDPRASSPSYVNPVVWAKTVAPFAVPFARDLQGPSGTSSPLFSTLDIFFGRHNHTSVLGREMLQLRSGYPPAWRAFLTALAEQSVADYIAARRDRTLDAAWRDALQHYAGTDGFLDRHRMKVYGYLELAFKVGRTLTIGGFSGAFAHRTWDEVDDALRESHRERASAARDSTC